ncbi:Hypothetical predicted protein [Xyrichtys novacula]|uniref:Uncharacterized protein n=1 Tax=Xyrichtys novacula TaxID=13765 RepID=A0AAV1HGK2_XYRNO|nr:Hypothetical predicted protein [Xyrichtys novacula]
MLNSSQNDIREEKVPRNIQGLCLPMLEQIISFRYEAHLLNSVRIISTAAHSSFNLSVIMFLAGALTGLDCWDTRQEIQPSSAAAEELYELYVTKFEKMETGVDVFSRPARVCFRHFLYRKAEYLSVFVRVETTTVRGQLMGGQVSVYRAVAFL